MFSAGVTRGIYLDTDTELQVINGIGWAAGEGVSMVPVSARDIPYSSCVDSKGTGLTETGKRATADNPSNSMLLYYYAEKTPNNPTGEMSKKSNPFLHFGQYYVCTHDGSDSTDCRSTYE